MLTCYLSELLIVIEIMSIKAQHVFMHTYDHVSGHTCGSRPSSRTIGFNGMGTLLVVSSLQGPCSATISLMRSVARAAFKRDIYDKPHSSTYVKSVRSVWLLAVDYHAMCRLVHHHYIASVATFHCQFSASASCQVVI
jgi:hypothetical protein